MILYIPINCTATEGGITNIPTNQSATAKLITKQLVTVRNRLVVNTDNMTNVLPSVQCNFIKKSYFSMKVNYYDTTTHSTNDFYDNEKCEINQC